MPNLCLVIVSLILFAYSLASALSPAVNYNEWNDTDSCHKNFMVNLAFASTSELIICLVTLRIAWKIDWNGWTTFLMIIGVCMFIVSASIGAYLIGHGRDAHTHICDVDQFMFVMVVINAVFLYITVGVVCVMLLCVVCKGCCDCLERKSGSACLDE